MDSNYLLANLSNLTCRICLQNYESLNSLYDEVDFEHDKRRIELRKLLAYVTSVEIASNELVIPTRICENCTDKLLVTYEFVCGVEKSERLLVAFKLDVDEVKHDGLKLNVDEVKHDGIELLNSIETHENNEDKEYQNDEHQDLQVIEQFEDIIEEETDVVPVSPDESDSYITNVNEEKLLLNYESAYGAETDTENAIYSDSTVYSDPLNYTKVKQQLAIGSRLGTYETSNWHKCDKCQRSFAKEETLAKHILTAHTAVSADVIAAKAPKPTIEQPIQCPHCPRTFARNDNLQRHLLSALHVNEVDATVVEKETVGDRKKHTYKRGLCPHCGQSFSQASLIVHIRRHTGEKPYKCTECDKGFPRRQDLTIHMRQHTGEKPHVCTICGKSFIRPNKLSRHMRIHTGVRPYKCTECEKSFSQSNDLKIHMRRHTGEKPYKCTVCNDAFISGTALKAHRNKKSHHRPDDDNVDPYASCRVTTRNDKSATCLEDVDFVIG